MARSAWVIAMMCALAGLARGQQERFVPNGAGLRMIMVEIRPEARVIGQEIRLKQIARWEAGDDLAMQQAGELVIGRFGDGVGLAELGLGEITRVLEGAGVNVAMIQFRGSRDVRVTRSDAAVKAESPVEPSPRKLSEQIEHLTGRMAAAETEREVAVAKAKARTLRDALLADLSERFQLPVEAFEVRFSGEGEKLVNLAEPVFRFDIDARQRRSLGDIVWDVTISSGEGRQKSAISANVRVWRTQVVALRAIPYKAPIGREDIEQRRVLVDRLGDDALSGGDQAEGYLAARDIAPGMVLTGRMVQAPQAVRVGELVSVTVDGGRVQVKWVAEARENGALGQTIRVRKPGTRDEFNVQVSGPQQGRLVAAVGGTNVAAR